MLYYANMAIDTIQNAKNTFLDTFVKEESIKTPMKEFVQAQREFTRDVVKSIAAISKVYTDYDYISAFKSK